MKPYLCLGFVLIVCICYAGKVEQERAKKCAVNFYLLYRPKIDTRINYTLYPVNTEVQANESGYFIFNVSNERGFIIVSAEDAVVPILGYSFAGSYTNQNLPPALIVFLDFYTKQINYARQRNLTQSDDIGRAWSELEQSSLKNTKDIQEVAPLLLLQWNQDYPYNAYCPSDAGGSNGHVYAGCTAVAMAQVFKYYNYPITGQGSNSDYHDVYGTLSANFGNTTYQWTQMPHEISEVNDAICTLLYHCGVAVEMYYGPDGSSGSPEPYAITNYFKYSGDVEAVEREMFSDTEWKQLIKTDLDNAHPVIYTGFGEAGGHAWNCDGYQGDNYFHMNWGWGGTYNGYFYVDDLTPGTENFSEWQSAVIHIYPAANYPQGCSPLKILTGLQGNFEDGSGIMNYENNKQCSWLIQTDCGNYVELVFDKFELEPNDKVIIHDGASTGSTVIAELTGSNPPVIASDTTTPDVFTSTATGMLVEFITNGSVTAHGWEASYNVIYCTNNQIITDLSGVVSDGSGECDYKDHYYCKWTIQPPGASTIILNFTEFDLATNNTSDFVKVYYDDLFHEIDK
ncbi:MAG: C10 family peptidase, partial [Bacteroidia bacterium]|nr:C10 family peptidase [Bacteroidia bacterium]